MDTEKDSPILTPFNVLLGTISSHLTKEDVRQIRLQLQGHLNKECLESLRVGHDVTEVLYQRGIVTEKKLAFFRKLLVGCQQDGLVELVDEFKTSLAESDGYIKQEQLRAQKRLQDLCVIMERQTAEIQNYKTTGDELRERLDNKQALLDCHKELCISQYETVDSLAVELSKGTMVRDLIEERAVESEEIIKLQEAELKKLQQELQNSRLNIKSRGSREKRVSIFDKHSNDKSKKSLESLIKQKEDKEETLRKYKESKEKIEAELYSKRTNVRQINLEILDKTKNLVKVDQELLESYEDIRKVRQQMRQNEINIWDIERELEETKEEYEKTKKNPTFDKSICIPIWRLEDTAKLQKVLKYDEVLEENSYCIGCHGNKTDSLQFDCPRGIAVTHNKTVFVADRGNCRVHIIEKIDYPIREAITMNNFYPATLTVNRKGNIIISDSQIIKVFTSDGKLSHNFLPVYNKRDERPSISALTVDREGHILAADITNHRIQKFRIDGDFLGFIGGPAYLRTPSGIAVTKHGDIIVSEYESHQLKVFYHHGMSFDTFGQPGIGRGHFMYPLGLAIDNKGNIIVADSMNHRIQVINMDGQYVSSFGRLGSDRGCLDTPCAVAVNRKGHVFVADSGNHRLTVFT